MDIKQAIEFGEDRADLFGGKMEEFIKLSVEALKKQDKEQQPKFIAKSDGTIEQIKNCNNCLFKKEWEKIGKLISVILEKQTEEEPKTGKWISVSERLPKTADVYRVTRYYPNNVKNPVYLVDACAFDGSNTWYNDNRINHARAYADNVIAWQENPEPYKPQKSEVTE